MRLKTVLAGVLAVWVQAALAATEVRLAVHDSYDLPKETITAFESANDAKVVILKMGDGNAMLNRLILTRNEGGVADAVYGLDNNTVAKAHAAGILAARQPASARTVVQLPHALAVDYGFVTLNYDKKWFAEKKLPLPKTLADLAQPAYRNLLVMPNPATSTPGLAFLLANIRGLGEEGAKRRESNARLVGRVLQRIHAQRRRAAADGGLCQQPGGGSVLQRRQADAAEHGAAVPARRQLSAN